MQCCSVRGKKGYAAGVSCGIGSDGPSLGRLARRHPRQRPHQPRRDRQDVPAWRGAGGPGRDRQGERARARPAGARHGLLRRRPGALHGLRHPRGAALPPGGPARAVGRRGGPGGGQERHLAGPHPPGRGAAAPAVRAGGAARGDERHQGRVVPAVAAGQPRRVLPRRGRHGGERGRLRAAGRRPRRERLPAAPLRGPGREGTHVLFGARLGSFADGETTLAHDALTALRPGMLCLADRQFFGHALWREAAATGTDLLWRVKRTLRLPREARLTDGSYLSTIYPGEKDRRHRTDGVRVRVVEYRLEGIGDAEPLYRLVTTLLDPAAAPASELAALYHERWEIEGALAELKTRLRGARTVLRSKPPELVRQEFWGLLLAHFAARGLMHEAALRADEDPDRLSFLHAVRVVRRKLPLFAALPPSGETRPA